MMGENPSFASTLFSPWISVTGSLERKGLMRRCLQSRRYSIRPAVVSSLLVFLFQAGAGAWSQEKRPGDSFAIRSPEICGAANQTLPKWAFEQESPEQAVQLLQDRLRSNPQDPMLNYQLGILYQAQNRFRKAIAQYWKSRSLDQDSDLYSLALASILFHCKQRREAIQVLQTFLERHPKSLPGIRFLCRIHIQERQFDQALASAQKGLVLDPGDSYGHYLLGVSHKGLMQFDEAKDALEQAVALAPSYAEAHLELGLLYSADHKTFGLAVENLKMALSSGLVRPDVHKNLGFVLLKLGEHEQAVEQLELALQGSPDYVEPHFLLADAFRKLGMKEKAAAALKRFQSLRTAARERLAVENRGPRLYAQGMDLLSKQAAPEKAYAAFIKSVEASPDMDLGFYRLAQIDYKRGNSQRAADWIRQAIQVYPLDARYHFVLARLLEQTHGAGSLDAVRTAIELNPTNADYHNLLGNLLFKQNDFQGAVQSYRRALEMDPDDPIPHLNLATTLPKIGAVQEAEREREIYFRLTRGRNPD